MLLLLLLLLLVLPQAAIPGSNKPKENSKLIIKPRINEILQKLLAKGLSFGSDSLDNVSDAGSIDTNDIITDVFFGITNPTVFAKEWIPVVLEVNEHNELIGYKNKFNNQRISYDEAIELSERVYKNRKS